MSDVDLDGIQDLVGIVNNPGSGFFEVHVLSGASSFQQSIMDIATPLTGPAQSFTFAMADTDHDGKPDLVAIKTSSTGSGYVEVHVLSGASSYQQFTAHVITSRGASSPNSGWSYMMSDIDLDGSPDLVGIFFNPGSGHIEIHVLSAASNYQRSISDWVTPLTPSPSAANFTFSVADLDHDGMPDLVGVAEYGTGSGNVEMYSVSGASNYQQWVAMTATGREAR